MSARAALYGLAWFLIVAYLLDRERGHASSAPDAPRWIDAGPLGGFWSDDPGVIKD